MKAIRGTPLIISAVLLLLSGCQDGPGIMDPADFELTTGPKSDPMEYPIWAGQNILVGSLAISNDEEYLYVTYTLFDGWELTETHVHVAADLAGVPVNRNGIPIPGQFDYGDTHDPTVAVFTLPIPLASYAFVPGDEIVVAAHAEVTKYDEQSQQYITETAWGGDQPGPGNRWWFYALYTLQTSGEEEESGNETAWARMYDDPYDFTYDNPNTTSWATYVRVVPSEGGSGETKDYSTFYFYAGQHYRVGEVYISRDAGYLYVQVVLDNTYLLAESHLNVQLDEYLLGSAPGQFPYIVEHDPYASGYIFSIPWDPAWTDQELCVALHGTVYGEY